jgi:creatinine amidohydrolase/Fe(II)-dependent formamide hydrolase-like protein
MMAENSRPKAMFGAIAALVFLALSGCGESPPAPKKTEISEMTWVELRDAVAHGHRTAIVPSGGIEENGPHMILGKHDRIVRWTSHEIARNLGNALVAPVISFAPEGNFDPPSGLLLYPGTIGLSDEAFAGVLEGVARSLKGSGFKYICLIADHGGSLGPQAEVAARLSREWESQGVYVFDIDAYYGAIEAQNRFLEAQGETPASIGEHAGIVDTSELMAIDPKGVDLSRAAAGRSGVIGDPTKATAERGRALLNIQVQAATAQIKALIRRSEQSEARGRGAEAAP